MLSVSSMRAVLASCIVLAIRGDYAPPRYTVDLGVAPEHRWDHVVAAEKDNFKKGLDTVFNSPQVKPLLPYAKRVVGNALEAWRILGLEIYREIRGIAREMGIDASEGVLLAAFYDMFAAGDNPLKVKACTGIVAQSASGEIYHGRNLDYLFKDAIGPITYEVDYVRNNKTVFTAVTLGINPTFNTAVKHGVFSITQNERDQGKVLENVWDVLIRGRMATFASIRKAAETIESFDDAVDYFSKVKLSAAAYFIVGGIKAAEGAVITRDRDSAVEVRRMNPANGTWYVLELNSDPFLPAPFGDNRRAPLQRALDAKGPAHIDASSLWDILSIQHVNKSAGEREPYNSLTIYTTVMQASNSRTFKTLVRDSREQFHQSVIV